MLKQECSIFNALEGANIMYTFYAHLIYNPRFTVHILCASYIQIG